MAKSVFSGLVTAWRFAGWPTRRSPSAVKATTDGVVRAPSAFSITRGVLPSMMATHELVVPRSMPITSPLTFLVAPPAPADSFDADAAPRRRDAWNDAAAFTIGLIREGLRGSRAA